MVSISHAIEFWLSVWWCVAVRRCEGAKIDVTQQIGVKRAKVVEDEGKTEMMRRRWERER